MERAKCFVKNIESKDLMEKWGCKWNCAPTYKMLTISQEPEAIVKTWGATGKRNKSEEAKAKKDSLAACPK